MKGGTVIVVAAPYVFLWFDARRVLFQFDPSGVRIGHVRLPWSDVTAFVVADSSTLGPQVLIGTRLRDGAFMPAGAGVLPPDPSMPAQLHVAVERKKFHLGKLTAKARRYAPAHVQIVNAAAGPSAGLGDGPNAGGGPYAGGSPYATGRPAAGNPYATPGQPGMVGGGLRRPDPGMYGPRWGIVMGSVLTCLAVAAVFGAALSRIAMVFPYEGDPTHGMALVTEDVLGLSDFPPGGPPGGLVTWPSMLFLLAALALACRALAPHAPLRALRVVGFAFAVAFPLVLLGNDAFDGHPLGNYESGWWLLHLGAFLGLAAFLAIDLTLARSTARATEPDKFDSGGSGFYRPGNGPY
ncbi:hypothetical protein ACIOEZ_07045 [Streptomyces sp. NPDC087866]|uniref:hypothetical protein n=1 Tax=unclassified Streptomyces TaxID=2593676 RepID=UPI00225A1235|nr:hypothetical protein [Streptomyces sp. NBC_01789]MCX4444876.1 hypothetical protein [Streptomyces sp. NBC_01789]